MKTLYFIGGPMGVGKTAVSRELLKSLPRCAFLDGDWCWTMQPFTVTDETKAMVMDNITHTLVNYLRCREFENIVFCWVMHQQQIIEDILSRLPMDGVRAVSVSLVCAPEVLSGRIRRDIDAGLRDESNIARALSYLPLYDEVKSVKVDTSVLSAAETAEQIRNIGEMNP
ncbi:MAG: AAA family ATPase [Clostridia bacterium]|nr:AAA family ATPase [Clostridia bacterium]